MERHLPDYRYDHLVWDGLEPVTYEQVRRLPAAFDRDPWLRKGAAHDEASEEESALTKRVRQAKRSRLDVTERAASGGAYAAHGVAWHLSARDLGAIDPKMGDAIVDEKGERWTVYSVQHNRFRQSWRLACGNLKLAFDLADEIDIERAAVVFNAAGVAVPLYPPAGGVTLYPALACRVQPLTSELQSDQRGISGMGTRFDVYVERMVVVRAQDRVSWRGIYLEITGLRSAERNDELPVLECVRAV